MPMASSTLMPSPCPYIEVAEVLVVMTLLLSVALVGK
jgi:hypothetical protein